MWLTGKLFALRRDVILGHNLFNVPGIFWEEASLHTLYDFSFSRPLLILMLLTDCVRPTDSGPEFLPEVHGLRRRRPGSQPDGWIPSVADSAPAGEPAAASLTELPPCRQTSRVALGTKQLLSRCHCLLVLVFGQSHNLVNLLVSHQGIEAVEATHLPLLQQHATRTTLARLSIQTVGTLMTGPDANTEIIIGFLQLTLRKDDSIDGTTIDANAVPSHPGESSKSIVVRWLPRSWSRDLLSSW
ncbi:hypothetical protein EI94DRAFT_1700341 [Lactarius quietus]|nr:hypothetical protein EI94DRAFT_1700341 [Lactarius quietus]